MPKSGDWLIGALGIFFLFRVVLGTLRLFLFPRGFRGRREKIQRYNREKYVNGGWWRKVLWLLVDIIAYAFLAIYFICLPKPSRDHKGE